MNFRGCEAISNNFHAGRPSTSINVEIISKIGKIIRSDQRMTIKRLSNDCDIFYELCQIILRGKF